MLATLTQEPFTRTGWVFERKLDGERVLAFRDRAGVRLRSRNRKEITSAYPEIAEALAAQTSKDFAIDGEVVAFDGSTTSFEKLQRRMQVRDADQARRTGVSVYYYLFDVMWLDGRDRRDEPLLERKAALRASLAFGGPLRYTAHRVRYGERYLLEACARGWEGLIAKRADAPYVSRRSTDWLKLKCVNEQEFVVGGYTDPRGSRTGFGALLLGVYDDGRLRYAGDVGTGFTHATLDALGRRLAALARDTPPFAGDGALPRRGVHWVHPKLVAQIGFTEWTRDGKLRHPRFLGLRRDKSPKDVVRERPR
jgi:bifunctional non-homologous end joining protein LigD